MARRKVKTAKRISNNHRALLTHAALKLADMTVFPKEELVEAIKDITRLKSSSHRSIGNVITTMVASELITITGRGNFKLVNASYPPEVATMLLTR